MSKAPWFGMAVVMAAVIITSLALLRWPKVRAARKGLRELAERHVQEGATHVR